MSTRLEAGALGLRAKTGRAIAVVLAGPAEEPRLVRRIELDLIDHKVPESHQPYHGTLEMPWPQADAQARKIAAVVEKIARAKIKNLISDLREGGIRIAAAVVVGGSPNDPARIANPHIRAHAAEGRIFPELLDAAARSCGLKSRWFTEHDFQQRAEAALALSPSEVARHVSDFAHTAGRPWRSDEKLAALAAWVALKQSG